MLIYDKLVVPFLKDWDEYQAAIRFLKKRRKYLNEKNSIIR